MGRLLRVVGVPGAGKTRFLQEQVAKWVRVDGISPDKIVGCSFTRTAAAVLRGRITDLPAQNFSTLHSLAYRGLGQPSIAEVGALRKLWNEQPKTPDEWKIGVDKADLEEGMVEENDYGSMLSEYSLYRAGRTGDTVLWEKVKYFAAAWEDFKSQNAAIDFQDMIDLALIELPVCPGDPVAFCVDEAQDLTPTQWALAQRWGEAAHYFLVAGDPAQAIFGFVGARPDELLAPLPAEQHRLLGRSYRLPSVLQQYAERWLSGHSGTMMAGRQYEPRAEGGQLRVTDDTWRHPLEMVTLVQELLEEHKDVMLLASCSYMLGPTLTELREAGIPFHNPYRRRNGSWNPLRKPREGSVSTVQRVRLFMADSWTGAGASDWLKMLPAEWFLETKKRTLDVLELLRWVSRDEVVLLLREQAAGAVLDKDLAWLTRVVAKPYQRPAELIASIIEHSGLEALDEEPRVVVGSIHSVKGAEAEAVVLFPDLSIAALQSQQSGDRDSIIRQFYVAYSRASHTLVRATAEKPERDVESI